MNRGSQGGGLEAAVDERTMRLVRPAELGVSGPSDRRLPVLILYDGDEIGALHQLTKDETVIGRTPVCDIVIPETRVSRCHAMLRRMAPGTDQFELIDLGSTNRTFLNGTPVHRASLQSGDKIGIGGRLLTFSMLDKTDFAYHARIVQMIHVDELTGLLTKRSLYRALELEIIRARRYKHPVSVLMMDLDHFKQVNDAYGHLVGSECLAQVGQLIRECTRETDVNGRYGGEEFITFLPETDTQAAFIVAERIRGAMEARKFVTEGICYHVCISIGIATLPLHGDELESLVRAADCALYQAKNTGRNRSVIYEPRFAEGVR